MSDKTQIIKGLIADPTNFGRVVDVSEAINQIPNKWGFYNQLGIFKEEFKASKNVFIPRTRAKEGLLVDRNWGERNTVGGSIEKDGFLVKVPHFPYDDAIYPQDVIGNIDWSRVTAGTEVESVANVRAEKMDFIQRTQFTTMEYARAHVMATGQVYAPSGTMRTSYGDTVDYYTEMGVTRQVHTVDLTSPTLDPLPAFEPILGDMQDTLLTGDILDRFLVVCSPEFFSALVGNPYVKDTYKYFSRMRGDEVLTGRLTATNLDARYRQFEYAGFTFIEYRGGYNGKRYVPAGEAVAFPLGTDITRTLFAPAERFGMLNAPAQRTYAWEYLDEKNSQISIMTEQNWVNVLSRPDLVRTLTFK